MGGTNKYEINYYDLPGLPIPSSGNQENAIGIGEPFFWGGETIAG
jgi:hypothetical protein